MRDFMNSLGVENLATAAEVISRNYNSVSVFVERELMPNYVGYVHEHLYANED
jgi:hypothetical protein